MAYRDDFSVMKARNNSLMLVLQSSKAREVMPINQDSFRIEVHANWHSRLQSIRRRSRCRCPIADGMKEEMAMGGREGVGSCRMEDIIILVEGGLNKQSTLFFRSPTVHAHSLLYLGSSSYERRNRIDRLV